jgi:hypothetical protein
VLAPPCAIVAEAVRLDVGRGVALVDLEASLERSSSACSVDARAALLAREEGRAAPELVAFAIDVDGRRARLGGPRGIAAIELPRGGGRVRVRAVLRGERFVAAPLSLEPTTVRREVRFVVRATTPWARAATAAVVRWTDRGVPALVSVDPARDREPLSLDARVRDGAVATLVVDAGAQVDDGGDERARAADLAKGGSTALSTLLTELPIAIATAPDERAAIARVHESARVALLASRATDPLVAAVGQRLASAIGRGFRGCRREAGSVPAAWPAPPHEMAVTGLLDDDEAGCPRVDHLLLANHADVHFAREGSAALLDALAEPPAEATIAPFFPRQAPLASAAPHGRAGWPRRRAGRIVLGLLALLVAVAAALATALRLMRSHPRETL